MTFHSPEWLYIGLLALIALAVLGFVSAQRRTQLLSKFASKKLLPDLSRTVSKPKVIIKNTIVFIAVGMIFTAIARPQWGYKWEESKTRGIDIIFAIDTSKSMLAEDVRPNRLERTKLAVSDLANSLGGDRIGLIAFSGQAFLQCPLTLDYDAFRMSLDALDTNIIKRGGTNISAAIKESISAFSKTSNRKIIILISDGEELEDSALASAKEAAKDGIVIYTLGVGAPNGELITIHDENGGQSILRDENGKPVRSKLNEAVLEQIAKATNGFYAPLNANGIDTIFNDGIKKVPQEEISARMRQLAIERFQFPLGLAIILLMLDSLIGTRKFFANTRLSSLIISLLLLGVFVQPNNLSAQPQNQTDPSAQITPQSQSEQEQSVQNTTPSEPEKPKYILSETPDSREYFNAAIDAQKAGDENQAKAFYLSAINTSPEDFPLHSKVFYNLANKDYNDAKNLTEKMTDVSKLKQKTVGIVAQSAQIQQNGLNLLKEGMPLLEAELNAISKAKTEEEKKTALENSPLKNKEFQQKLKNAIASSEGIEKLSTETNQKIEKADKEWESVLKKISQAENNYKSAVELDPQNIDAKINFQKATEATKSAKRAEKEVKDILENFSESTKELPKIAETQKQLVAELKKLVRDDNQNQDNQQQNQNNQNNQNNSQNQQNQNQQNDSQNNQDNKQDNQQNQNNSQDKQNDSNKDNQQNNKSDKQEDKNKQENQNQQQNKNNQQQNQDNQQQNSADKKDEQAIDNKDKNSAENSANQEQQDSANKHKEQAIPQKEQGKEEQASAKQAKQAEDTSDDFRKHAGAMSRREAKELLESMKGDEKFLPRSGFGNQTERYNSSYKDW